MRLQKTLKAQSNRIPRRTRLQGELLDAKAEARDAAAEARSTHTALAKAKEQMDATYSQLALARLEVASAQQAAAHSASEAAPGVAADMFVILYSQMSPPT